MRHELATSLAAREHILNNQQAIEALKSIIILDGVQIYSEYLFSLPLKNTYHTEIH